MNKRFAYMLIFFILSVGMVIVFQSCRHKDFTTSGIISDIKTGEDTFTATLKTKDGREYTTETKNIKLAKKIVMFTVGDRVSVTGDVPDEHKNSIVLKDIEGLK